MKISHDKALAAISHVIELAQKDGGNPVTLAVVDASGFTLAVVRMDGAPERVIAIARGKAYTAAKMGCSTEAFLRRLRNERLEVEWFCDAALTPLPGGIPITHEGACLGAVGVSGRSLEEDVALATQFADYLRNNL